MHLKYKMPATTTELRNHVYRLKLKKLQKFPKKEMHAILVTCKVELKCISLESEDHEY